MALTTNIRARTMWEDFYVRLVEVDFTGDTSYPTGGESLTDTNCGLNDDNLYVFPFPADGYLFEYDRANQKLKVFHFDYNNASDGAAIEVPDTTDLSAITGVLLLAIGRRPA